MTVKRAILLITAFALATVTCAATVWLDTYRPRLREVVVPVAGLDREMRLLQVSDAHGDGFGERQAGIERLLRGRRYDAVVLTGDALDSPWQERDHVYELATVLRRHSGRVYFLRGNHDPLDLGADLVGHGVTPMDSGQVLPLSAEESSTTDAALVYATHATSIREAEGSGRRVLVIVSHTAPDAHRLAAARSLGAGKRLFVCGHTHAGQVRLPLIGALGAPMSWYAEEGGHVGDNEPTLLPDLRGRLVFGMYEREGQSVFVSGGLGRTGIGFRAHTARFRLGARAEIVEFRFVPAAREG